MLQIAAQPVDAALHSGPAQQPGKLRMGRVRLVDEQVRSGFRPRGEDLRPQDGRMQGGALPAHRRTEERRDQVVECAGHLGLEDEVNRGNGIAALDLLEGDLRRGAHLRRGQLGLAEDERQRHGEAGGMGGGDQFLGVGAGHFAEAGAEAVALVVEHARLGRDADALLR